MTSFSKKAKAEAAKYKHQISPKARHKYTFASDCGAGKQGSKGFQPGNTCGGDGDGKNDAGDQGGGDKSAAPKSFVDYVGSFYGEGGVYDMGATDEQIENAYATMVKEYGQDSIDHDSIDRERLREILIRDEGLTFSGEETEPTSDAPAAEGSEYETIRKKIDNLEDSGEISSQDAAGLRDDLDAKTGMGGYAPESDADAPSTEQIMEDMRNQQAELDAEIARLTQQNAEQKSAADADIAEAYKDVTEEDIQDMLDEKDITAADAEEMRGYVAQAQAAQADAPAADDAGDVRPVKPSSNVMSDGTHAIDHQAYQDYVSELSDEELSYIRIDARESMQANPDGLKAGYYADEVNYVEMEMAERMKDSDQTDDAGDVSALSESELEEVLGPRASAPEAQGDAPEAQGVETDWDSVQTGGKYEGVYPQGYKVDHAGSGERPWVVSDPSGDTYDFADESNAEVAAITLGLAADGQLQGDMAEDSPEAFAAFVVDHNGEYRDTTADKINDLSARFDDAYIGKYEGGITEYARQYIDDMGGPSEAVQNISSYSDYTKWNTELKNADEGYGYREADGGYEVYDRQESDVEAWNPEEDQVPTYSSLYEAEKAAEEMNNDLLDEMMSESTAKHPGSGESYANRYFNFESYARDLELGGDIIDLGDGELIFGNY